MRKIKWIDLFVAGICLGIMGIFFFVPEDYDYFVKHPFDHGSGATGSKLLYFLLYKIDSWIGKTGVFIFFFISFLWCLRNFLNENMASLKNRYNDWKEKRGKQNKE